MKSRLWIFSKPRKKRIKPNSCFFSKNYLKWGWAKAEQAYTSRHTSEWHSHLLSWLKNETRSAEHLQADPFGLVRWGSWLFGKKPRVIIKVAQLFLAFLQKLIQTRLTVTDHSVHSPTLKWIQHLRVLRSDASQTPEFRVGSDSNLSKVIWLTWTDKASRSQFEHVLYWTFDLWQFGCRYRWHLNIRVSCLRHCFFAGTCSDSGTSKRIFNQD